MNNIAEVQLFELGILLATAVIYVCMHFACSGVALLISGQKSGVIRGFLQGLLLVGLFSLAVIFLFNGKLKVYYVITYLAVVMLLVKFINWIINKIKGKRIKNKNNLV